MKRSAGAVLLGLGVMAATSSAWAGPTMSRQGGTCRLSLRGMSRPQSDTQAGAAACRSLPLVGVYGRRAGSVPSYRYSAALKGAPVIWNAAALDRWLTSPPAFIPGINMQAQVDSE
jgi:hypothetical protein